MINKLKNTSSDETNSIKLKSFLTVANKSIAISDLLKTNTLFSCSISVCTSAINFLSTIIELTMVVFSGFILISLSISNSFIRCSLSTLIWFRFVESEIQFLKELKAL